MASMHLRFAARLTAWTNAGCRNASKLWGSVIWCREREVIVERMREWILYWMLWSNSRLLYLLSAISVIWSKSAPPERLSIMYNDRARRGGHVNLLSTSVEIVACSVNFRGTLVLLRTGKSHVMVMWLSRNRKKRCSQYRSRFRNIGERRHPSIPRLSSCLCDPREQRGFTIGAQHQFINVGKFCYATHPQSSIYVAIWPQVYFLSSIMQPLRMTINQIVCWYGYIFCIISAILSTCSSSGPRETVFSNRSRGFRSFSWQFLDVYFLDLQNVVHSGVHPKHKHSSQIHSASKFHRSLIAFAKHL